MQNKLLLSLWLLGGALYLGGTIFFAHAILGPGSRTTELTADKGLTTTAAIAAPETQCPPASAAAAATPVPAQSAAKSAENGAADAASEPKEPVRTAAVADGQEAQEAADGDSAPQLPTADAGAQPTGDADSPDGRGLGETATPEADQGQAEWAQVVAAAADVHAQPSAEAPSIYALPAGRQVRVLTHENGWTQVQDVASGGTGWVEARALAPIGAPGGQDRGYGNQYDDAYADDNGQDDWRWRRRHRQGGIGDFVRRALGGGW
jgi:lipoprotein-anchoring transpeptidase ErfK/SrfK